MSLILVSNPIKTKQQYERVLNGDSPRQDYIEIAHVLGAEILCPDTPDTFWYGRFRQIEQRIKLNLVEATLATRQMSKHSKILSTSEKVAIPLAAMLNISGRAIPHVVIGHKLSSYFKSILFRAWPLQKTFSHVICVCQAQADYAVENLNLPESKVDFVYDKVDHHFFRPSNVSIDDYILTVGREQRDYETLLQAVSGTGIKLVVVASSPWVATQAQIHTDEIEDITVLSHIPYQALRDLYARARLVVIPLFDVDYAAGVNTVLETMAMGKPLIVSHSRGIQDYVVHNETGKYVSPGDAQELREVILSLWGQSGEQKRMGTNARQAVEEGMNLDNYVSRVAQIVHNVGLGTRIN